jgi:hypothetical protein
MSVPQSLAARAKAANLAECYGEHAQVSNMDASIFQQAWYETARESDMFTHAHCRIQILAFIKSSHTKNIENRLTRTLLVQRLVGHCC